MFDIYLVDMTLDESEFAEVMFIEAENQNDIEINDNFILGTNLTEDSYYCIKSINKDNENKFLKWDGIKHNYYYGLVLNKTNDEHCPNNNEYFFKLEYNKKDGVVKIKNNGSNNYISIDQDKFFVLHDLLDGELYLVSNIDNSTTIRTKHFQVNTSYFYLGNYTDSSVDTRIPGIPNFYESESFIFVKVSVNNITDDEQSNSNANTSANYLIIYFLLSIVTVLANSVPLF